MVSCVSMTPNKKVAIIEDEATLRGAMNDALSRAGFTCYLAENGETGLQLCLTQKPDLILLDLLMPVMDGMTMLRELRKDTWGATARVIVLTNYSADDAERVRGVIETVPELYLVKSDWPIGKLVKKAEELLQ